MITAKRFLFENSYPEFHIDYLDVAELYTKCDNTGSYHGNCYSESIYRISKEKDTATKRLNFNKPQKGKDHCDHDSAVARNALRSYADKGNNILWDTNISQALAKSNIRNI